MKWAPLLWVFSCSNFTPFTSTNQLVMTAFTSRCGCYRQWHWTSSLLPTMLLRRRAPITRQATSWDGAPVRQRFVRIGWVQVMGGVAHEARVGGGPFTMVHGLRKDGPRSPAPKPNYTCTFLVLCCVQFELFFLEFFDDFSSSFLKIQNNVRHIIIQIWKLRHVSINI